MTGSADFIRQNLQLVPAPLLPELRLYTAHPGSGLSRLQSDLPPYWAYVWAGGAALARHVLAHPDLVRGLRVLDLGAGSGVVAIAAALSGARSVLCAETDPNAVAAIGLNAAANGVTLGCTSLDVTNGPAPAVDLVLVGDLFYSADVAARTSAFLDRCLAAKVPVLIGDPGRDFLPLSRLFWVAEHPVRDVGDGPDAPLRRGFVYSWGLASEQSEPAS